MYGLVGSALYVISATSADTNINITNSKFTHNAIQGGGGELYIYFGSDTYNHITIFNSTFNKNRGSGLFVQSETNAYNDVTITSTTFTNNNIYIGGGVVMLFDTGTYNNVTIM